MQNKKKIRNIETKKTKINISKKEQAKVADTKSES